MAHISDHFIYRELYQLLDGVKTPRSSCNPCQVAELSRMMALSQGTYLAMPQDITVAVFVSAWQASSQPQSTTSDLGQGWANGHQNYCMFGY